MNHTYRRVLNPNLGVEQSLFHRHLTLRAGRDETSDGAGLTVQFTPVRLDVADVYDLAVACVGSLFGRTSHSILATFTFDYATAMRSHR